MAANLHRATGRTVGEWVAVVQAAGIDGFMSVVGWLQAHHGLGHFQARLVAEAHRDGVAHPPGEHLDT